MEKTTIQIDRNTLERLKALKQFGRQSYSDLLSNILDNVEEETLSQEEIDDIKIALENVKRGKVKPIGQIAKELGIALR
jgi:predicted CopG family antitoxin